MMAERPLATDATWLALLLADRSPCLRWRVLVDLLGRPMDDDEVQELAALRSDDSLVRALVSSQEPDGAWSGASLDAPAGPLKSTAHALMRLGYLGFDSAFAPVARGVAYLMSQQLVDGSWPLPRERQGDDGDHEGYSMIPLQTVFPLLALAMCGYACDPDAERGYAWLLEQRLEDGAWPTGLAAGNLGRVAGYRRLAHSRWGCRSNTTGALLCLAHHPERRHHAPARRALDLLLGRESREVSNLGYEVARYIGAENIRGFLTHFARFDPGLLLDLCWRVGADTGDPRIADLAAFVRQQQLAYGLWHYAARPQASRWVSLDLVRSLTHLGDDAGWMSQEPRTPFQPYPSKHRRY